jgi:ATP-binding cassette subfamily F protein 3
LARQAAAATSSKSSGNEDSRARRDSDSSAASAAASSTKSGKRKRKFPYRKPDDVEKEIHTRESRLEELQQQLVSPDVLRDGRRVREVTVEIEQQQQTIAQLYEHWEEALELNN